MATIITTKKASQKVPQPLTNSEYKQYQEDRERPRGAFAEIWTPSSSPVSLHKVRPEHGAIARVSKLEKTEKTDKPVIPEGLFLASID